MPSCFVIQPFDNGKFDKRYDGVFEPAIIEAGMKPYRVDRDPTTVVVIETIEKNIKEAAVCLADITEDNPNVWYELGYAFASNRPVVLVCSEERLKEGKEFPFDIRHRPIITYITDAPQDFDEFKAKIKEKLEAMLKQSEMIEQIASSEPLTEIDGLSQHELTVLALLGNESPDGESPALLNAVKRASETAGLTQLAFNLALRGLRAKGFAIAEDIFDHYDNERYEGMKLSDAAWRWIEQNVSKFVLHSRASPKAKALANLSNMDDDIPF